MKKGERRKVETRCVKCRDRVIIRSLRCDPPFTVAEVKDLETNYICADCTGRE